MWASDERRSDGQLAFTFARLISLACALWPHAKEGYVRELICDEKLMLQYVPGFGAWTYHLRIPGTADIPGSWGSLKVSGTVDGYEIRGLNLAPRKGEDKILSINKRIREAIGRDGGDIVTVTLFLHAPSIPIDASRHPPAIPTRVHLCETGLAAAGQGVAVARQTA